MGVNNGLQRNKYHDRKIFFGDFARFLVPKLLEIVGNIRADGNAHLLDNPARPHAQGMRHSREMTSRPHQVQLQPLIDVRNPDCANEIVDLAVDSLKSKRNWGLAPHSLFTASPNLFRRCEEVGQREHILLTTHLAESREEFSMFYKGCGPLYELMKDFGRDMNDCGHQTPLALFHGARNSWTRPLASARVRPHWILVHLNELSESDFEWLATPTQVTSRGAATEFVIVHCPRSHTYFGHSPFSFEKLRERGSNICLGTDSLASNKDLSLFAEMREFQRNFPAVSPEEIFSMVTKNAAAALAGQSFLGQIKSGAFADLIAVPYETECNIFEQIIAFSQAVSWSMIDGVLQKPA